MKYYLAIDIGATSGRHIIGYFQNGQLSIKEIYRFKTKITHKNDHYYWNLKSLISEVIKGLKAVKESGYIPERIGIDTFGVDYVLVDSQLRPLLPIFSYRDVRGAKIKESLNNDREIFSQTGIQPIGYNTYYQLLDDQKTGRLQEAKYLMMLPSYIAFYLTGVMQNEITILSTSGLFDVQTMSLAKPLLKILNVKESFFAPPITSGSKIGPLTSSIAKQVGFTADVYAALEHDTASSFFGSGATDDDVLISSGTWSLLGALLDKPTVTNEVLFSKFSNEIGYQNKIRFLQNITGMWLINEVLKESKEAITILQAIEMAKKSTSYVGIFDIDNAMLSQAGHLIQKIKLLLKMNGYEVPNDSGELYYAIFHSMAFTYKIAIKHLKEITGRDFKSICVFGGGSQNTLLNKLIEEQTDMPVKVGPIESTAEGNIKSII